VGGSGSEAPVQLLAANSPAESGAVEAVILTTMDDALPFDRPTVDGPTVDRPTVRIRRERPADPADVAAVRAVSVAAFPTDAEARLLDALRAAGDCDPARSLVAEVAGIVVGHALLTAMILERPDGRRNADRIVALGPVAVTPEWQKRGIGGELVRAVLAQAEREGAAALVLLGHPTYYPRFGFRPAREQGLLPPAPWPDAAWLACRLPAWTPLDAGVVHYARAFMEME
jgi:putative acetyltransferase